MNKSTTKTKKPAVVGTDICDRPIRQGDYLLCVRPTSFLDGVRDGKIYRAQYDAGSTTIGVRTEGNGRPLPSCYFGDRFVTLGQ